MAAELLAAGSASKPQDIAETDEETDKKRKFVPATHRTGNPGDAALEEQPKKVHKAANAEEINIDDEDEEDNGLVLKQVPAAVFGSAARVANGAEAGPEKGRGALDRFRGT